MTVSRLTSGVTTATKTSNLGQFGLPDPSSWHVWFDDFDKFTAGDWTITTVELGAGSATEAISNADGGVLLVTNAAGDNDSDFFNYGSETFLFEAGKKIVFKARVKVSDP